MKTAAALAICALLLAAALRAQAPSGPRPYKVVFDLTSDDPLDQRAVLRWIAEIGAVNPQTEMEVVMYGRGLALVVTGRTTMSDEVAAAMARPNVAFRACAIAMRNQKI